MNVIKLKDYDIIPKKEKNSMNNIYINNQKDYLNLYQKYKKKYLDLKIYINSNRGGSATLTEEDPVNHNLERADINEEVVSILEKTLDTGNLGQNNCGIIPYLDYILKCSIRNDGLLINDNIREYFPQYYLWPNGDFIKQINEKPFYIMEKLDGDLTKYIIEQSYIRAYGSLEDRRYGFNAFKLYYDTLPKTTIESLFGWNHNNKYLSEEAIKILNEIKSKVKSHIVDILNSLQPKIIELHHNLIKRNYKYSDLKLDNIGYKILEDKNIKLYFIDVESGLFHLYKKYEKFQIVRVLDHQDLDKEFQIVSLSKDNKKANLKATSISIDPSSGILLQTVNNDFDMKNIDVNKLEIKDFDDEEEVRDFLEYLHGLSTYLQNYSVLGQYNLNSIYKLEPRIPIFNLDVIKEEINNITIGDSVLKKYNEEKKGKNYLQYRRSGHNDFFCIQICTVYLRLVRFDDYRQHPSNPKYRNDNFPPVDELFNDLDSLLLKLKEMYPY